MDATAARDWFEKNFRDRGDRGAAASLWGAEGELLHFSGGFADAEGSVPWQPDTPVLVWSATKGPAAAACLHAWESAGLAWDEPVCTVWPAFAAAGKSGVTFRQLLQHQAGLPVLEKPVPVEDRDAVVEALAQNAPAWEPGTAHGYHPRTFGFLLDEIVRRVCGGESLGAYWRRVFAGPLSLDFWIGVPPEMVHRVAPIFSSKKTLPKGDPFLTAYFTPNSLTSRAFASPRGLHSAAAMNAEAPRRAEYPGFGGIGTARALAKFYALLAAGGVWQGKRFFPEGWLGRLLASGITGMDRVLCMHTAFNLGFMRDPVDAQGAKLRDTFGPGKTAFGHPGAGGAVGFADPERGWGFAYVTSQMEPGVLPDDRVRGLVRALFGETARA
jgi:CubicO group peptidase (beta-lactamase class C family)